MRLSNLLLASALLISTGCAFYVSGVRAAEDGAVVERKAYEFPSYERAVETTMSKGTRTRPPTRRRSTTPSLSLKS